MINFHNFFKQRMTRFFSILFASLLLLANLAIYLVSSVQYTRQIERLETSFVEMMSHLLIQESSETAIVFVEHYDHTHGVNLTYYDEDGIILYQSEIAPENTDRIALVSGEGMLLGEVVLDYQTSFLDAEITWGLIILNSFSLLLFLLALMILYHYLNAQYALLFEDMQQIGTADKPFRFSDMEDINNRYLASLTIESELKEMQTHYVQMLAHDVKTPLTVMKAILEGVKLGRLPWNPDLNDNLLAEIATIEQLVPQFIAANLDQLPKRQNIAWIIQNQLNRLQEVFLTKQIAVEASLDDFELNVSSIDIIRIVEHLVFNAFYYSEPGKRILVKLNAKDRTFVVQDEGIGMSPSTLEKVLKGSYREERSLKYHQKGSGIGLQIVQGIVRRLHARIQFESQEHIGTTVTIRF